MSVILNVLDLPQELRKKIVNDLTVKSIAKFGNKYVAEPDIHAFEVFRDSISSDATATDGGGVDKVCIPFSYAYHHLQKYIKPSSNSGAADGISFPNNNLNMTPMFNRDEIKREIKRLAFTGTLLPRQEKIKTECFEILNRTRSIILSLYTGFGKSIFVSYLCTRLLLLLLKQGVKGKVVILTHRIDIAKQLKNYIHRVVPGATVQTEDDVAEKVLCSGLTKAGKPCKSSVYHENLCKKHYTATNNSSGQNTGTSNIGNSTTIPLTKKSSAKCDIALKDCDFYIFNASNISKRNPEDLKGVQILVIDEAHVFCAQSIAKCFYRMTPRYLIALSATPERSDGKDRILELYFGPEMISFKLHRPFNVYIFPTQFKPKSVGFNSKGGVNWNDVLISQCTDEKRNNTLIALSKYFSCRNILLLCKRVEQGQILNDKLKAIGEDVELYVRSQRTYDSKSRIFVSTYSKSGTGFDHPKLDMLIVASDAVELFQQPLGRVFRRDDVIPIIIDFRDSYKPLSRHLDERIKIYQELGGIVKDLSGCFPELERRLK